MERYLGEPLPLDATPEDPSAMREAMSPFLSASLTALNLEAVRLAMQGPLAPYFPTIVYDASTNKFAATTEQQLTPMYEAIFAAAPGDAAGAESWLAQWKPIIDVVLGDFPRGDGREVTYAYMFESMVRAYENSSLPLDIAQAASALGVPSGLVVFGGTTLTGTDGPDIFYIAGGDQTAAGGLGLDNYVFGHTFGHVTIDDDEPGPGQQDPDILRFTDLNPADVTATRSGLDLVITVDGTDKQVTVVGEFTGWKPGLGGTSNLNDDHGVGQISFADGTVWDLPDIAFAVSHPQPTDDTLVGTASIDVLDGGAGNDSLAGGDSGDIYIFGRGYGHDTIEDREAWILNDSPDYVKFGPGITQSDVTFHRDGGSSD